MSPQPLTDTPSIIRRLFRKAVQQGRSKRRGEAYSLRYVKSLRAARTPLAAFVNSLLDVFGMGKGLHHRLTLLSWPFEVSGSICRS